MPVTNMKRSIEFYSKIGLNLIVSSADNYARFEFPEGNSTLSLSLVQEIPTPQLIKIYFEVPDLDEHFSLMKSKGISFGTKPQLMPWLWKEVPLKDPDGNLIVIFEAGSNRKNPPWRIN